MSFPRVVINEALTRPDAAGVSRVELRNLSRLPADISGWFISDNFDRPKKFRIPAGTVLPAGGFVVFTGADFGSTQNALDTFRLDPFGEEICLFSADDAMNLTGYAHRFSFETQSTNGTLAWIGRAMLQVNGVERDICVVFKPDAEGYLSVVAADLRDPVQLSAPGDGFAAPEL